MSDLFRSLDLSGLVLAGDVFSRFSWADVPANTGVPFVIVHLKADDATQKTLRLDLDKRVFLGDVEDEKVRASAAEVAHYISGHAFGLPQTPRFPQT